MVYLKKWENFTIACQNLVDNSIKPTRYTILFKASSGNFVLKVTDDITCIKFKTNKSIYLNRFENFNRDLIKRFTNKKGSLPVSSTTISSSITSSKVDGDILMNESIIGSENIIIGEESKSKKKKGKKKK